MRPVAAPFVRRRCTRPPRASSDGSREALQVGQRLRITVDVGAEHAGPGRRGEGAAAADAQPEPMVPGSRTLQPLTQVIESFLGDFAEERERHVPAVLAGPAQSWPITAQSGDGGVKFGQRRRWWRDRDEQAHATLLPGSPLQAHTATRELPAA
jgi:hypothetical protein